MTETKPNGTETRSFTARVRRHFITGLIVLAPVWLTVYIVILVVRLLGGLLAPQLRYFAEIFLAKNQHTAIITTVVDMAAFILTVILITLVGFAVSRVLGKRALEVFDSILRRIPFVKEVYGGIRQVSDVLFGDKSNFQRVVAVRFPTESAYSIGFMTGERPWKIPDNTGDERISVFVPTTPNPTTGFLLYCRPKDVVSLPLTVDEAMKIIISVGTLTPERAQELSAAASAPPTSA